MLLYSNIVKVFLPFYQLHCVTFTHMSGRNAFEVAISKCKNSIV